jgi:hypothetical protein
MIIRRYGNRPNDQQAMETPAALAALLADLGPHTEWSHFSPASWGLDLSTGDIGAADKPRYLTYRVEVDSDREQDRIVGGLQWLVRYLRFKTDGYTRESLNLLPGDASVFLLRRDQQRGALILATDLERLQLIAPDAIDHLMTMDMGEFLALVAMALEGESAFNLLDLLPQ